ncbi:hypothetical protein [Corallococcus sp. 4LFB]|uniref:hypothetical protein n=1 Tax=Corallococcus sp. 4LFB TaxID=3383249 RepID=UPI0039764893
MVRRGSGTTARRCAVAPGSTRVTAGTSGDSTSRSSGTGSSMRASTTLPPDRST